MSVFVSLTVKAVHLELVTDLTSQAFLGLSQAFYLYTWITITNIE